MSFTTISYAVGAVFLLVTLLVLASRAGILPTGFAGNKLFPILAGVVVFAAVNFNVGPYFVARWRSVWDNAGAGIALPHQAPTASAAAAPAPHRALHTAAHASIRKQPAADLTGVVVTRGISTEADERTPAIAAPDLPASNPADTTPVASAAPAQPADGRFKHAVKRVGRFLHITRGAAEEEQERR